MLVERHQVETTAEMVRLCSLSKDLYNRCNYLMRQAWFAGKRFPDINVLVNTTKDLDCFKNLHNTKTAKQTVRMVLTDWANFRKAIASWKRDPSKFLRMPKPPKYKDKLAPVVFYKETIRRGKKYEGVIISTNDLFTVKSSRKFQQVVLVPKTFGFVVEVQYEKEVKKEVPKKPGRGVMAVDLGLNRLCAITSDQLDKSILVNGRVVKSINQWYNKNPSKKRSRKRYWRLENLFHHVSRYVVDLAVRLKVGTIVVGRNVGWKRKISLGKKTNQAFSYVSFGSLLHKIQYKAKEVGIEVVLTEEAYTSKASFIDRDPIPSYQKGREIEFSGSRVKRGLYKTKGGLLLNADANGSANICRKVIQNEGTLLRLDRSLAARPVVLNPLQPAA